MSTIAFADAAVVTARTPRTTGATRLRLTTRGRRVLLALAALPLAAGIAFAALSGGSAVASGETGEGAVFETIMVLPGDTLWGIAAEVAPGADPREVIGEISRLNQLRGGAIIVGQELAIPAQYTS